MCSSDTLTELALRINTAFFSFFSDSQFFSIDPSGEIRFDTRGLAMERPLYLVTYTAGDTDGYPQSLSVTGVVGVVIQGIG
jgi:hypothetical protein